MRRKAASLPAKIQFGPIAVKLLSLPDDVVDRFGDYDETASEIRLNLKLPDDRLAATLLHESLHAIWSSSGLPEFAAEEEERIVRPLALGVAEFFRENPALVMWMLKSLVPR